MRVEDMAQSLRTLIPDGSILIGHSLGGMVAIELAARVTKSLAALVLIETVPSVSHTVTGRALSGLASQITKRCAPRVLAHLSAFGQTSDTRTELIEQLSSKDNASLGAAMTAACAYDGRSKLADIKVPTLIIVAQNNRATHVGAKIALSLIPNAKLVMLGGGHILHHDNPVQLRRTIDSFLHEIQ